jgi:hypothetical protein
MDDLEKLQIRRQATRRFIHTVIVMIALGGLFLWVGYGMRAIHRNESELVLMQRSRLFFDESMRYWADQGKELAVFAPPPDPAEFNRWTERIEDHFGHPVSVFLKHGGEITWARPPLNNMVVDSTRYLVTAGMPQHHMPFRRFGDLQVWHRSFQLDGGYESVWLVQDSSSASGWGVVYNADDDWYSFLHTLNMPRGAVLEFGGPAWMLNNTFALPPSESRKYLIGVRAFMKDSLVFESPDLDTSTYVHVDDLKDGRRIEYYAPPRDLSRLTHRVLTRQAWIMAIYPILLIVPFYRWYCTVKRLSRPDASNATDASAPQRS